MISDFIIASSIETKLNQIFPKDHIVVRFEQSTFFPNQFTIISSVEGMDSEQSVQCEKSLFSPDELYRVDSFYDNLTLQTIVTCLSDKIKEAKTMNRY